MGLIRLILYIIGAILYIPLGLLGIIIYVSSKEDWLISLVVEDYWDWVYYLELKDLKFKKQFNLKQMKAKYLFQALRFACVPTLAVLTLLFCGFFSISRALDFISSDSGWAIFLRILLVVAELVLIAIMYFHYEEKGEREAIFTGNGKVDKGNYVPHHKDVYELKSGWNYNNKFIVYETENDNIVIVEHKPRA